MALRVILSCLTLRSLLPIVKKMLVIFGSFVKISMIAVFTKPTFIKGKVGDEFSLSSPAIRNYTLYGLVVLTHGIFTYDQQAVTYFYRRDSWKDVDYTPHYLKIQAVPTLLRCS